MKKIAIVLLALLLPPAYAESERSGDYLGAKSFELPLWFKRSFLEFEEDVAEAAENNKRIMLYFHQDACPYCARLVEENFTNTAIRDFVQQHFEVIDINMWGDRQVVSVGGKAFTEKTFAAALKVQYTPTLIFLDEQGKTALRLNGYYPPEQFRLALDYVAQKQEKQQRFNEFVTTHIGQADQGLIDEDFFLDAVDLRQNRQSSARYLAIYFEAPACEQCRVLHEKILVDAPTRELVTQMDNVQLNILGDDLVTTPSGERMSQRDYARKLDIGYTPSIVFLDPQGTEVHRIEGFLKTFHFQSSLAYVLEQGYRTEPSFQRYIAARGEKLREMGFDTDIWGYKSFHPANEK